MRYPIPHIVVLFALTACQSTPAMTPNAPQAPAQPGDTSGAAPMPLAPTAGLPVVPGDSPASAGVAPAASAPPAVASAAKTDFVATDPTTVSLALGTPQLVEFYAVW